MKDYQVFDADLLPWKKTVADWILPKCELTRVNRTIEAGDEIIVTNHPDNTEIPQRRFVVLPVGNRPCVEPHDDYGVMVVAHTEEQP